VSSNVFCMHNQGVAIQGFCVVSECRPAGGFALEKLAAGRAPLDNYPEISISAEILSNSRVGQGTQWDFLRLETVVFLKLAAWVNENPKIPPERRVEIDWWAVRDSNPRLPACKAGALTN